MDIIDIQANVYRNLWISIQVCSSDAYIPSQHSLALFATVINEQSPSSASSYRQWAMLARPVIPSGS